MDNLESLEESYGPDGEDDASSQPRSIRNQEFSEKIHDRARQSAVEVHKLLIGLSTGALAVYFLALTGSVDPALTLEQAVALIVGLSGMALALGFGVLGWFADTKRNFFWARALITDDTKRRHATYKKRNQWRDWKRRFSRWMGYAFGTGILASCAYLVLRVLSGP